MNSAIYTISAYFENTSSSVWIDIGTYDDYEVAAKIKNKWQSFFKETQALFHKDPTIMYKMADYGIITYIQKIEIHKRNLNSESFIDNLNKVNKLSNGMLSLIKEYDRDFKIKETLKNG